MHFERMAVYVDYFLSLIKEMPTQARPIPSITIPDLTSNALRIVKTVTATPIAIATAFGAISMISAALLTGASASFLTCISSSTDTPRISARFGMKPHNRILYHDGLTMTADLLILLLFYGKKGSCRSVGYSSTVATALFVALPYELRKYWSSPH